MKNWPSYGFFVFLVPKPLDFNAQAIFECYLAINNDPIDENTISDRFLEPTLRYLSIGNGFGHFIR